MNEEPNLVWFSYLTGLGHLLPGEAAPIDEKAFPDAIYTMDIGHNDINGVLHLPYHTMLEKLPPVIAEIKKAIEVTMLLTDPTLLLHLMVTELRLVFPFENFLHTIYSFRNN